MRIAACRRLIALVLSIGVLTPMPAQADSRTFFLAQDPPVIPRALLKRLRPRAHRFIRTELFFGTATPDEPVSDERFRAFLDAEVTPRFPDGLTVLNASGQWRAAGGVTKEQARILVIWHDRFPSRDADIEAIRSAYKQRFDQESVLRIDSVSCVSF